MQSGKNVRLNFRPFEFLKKIETCSLQQIIAIKLKASVKDTIGLLAFQSHHFQIKPSSSTEANYQPEVSSLNSIEAKDRFKIQNNQKKRVA